MSGNRPTPTFYILHGNDEFSLRAAVQTMRAQMGDPTTADLNTTVLDGKSASAGEVLSAVRSVPFLSDKRLALVEGMLTWLSRKGASKSDKEELEKLGAGLSELPEWARLVFVELSTLSDRNSILKLAKELPGGYHKEYNPPRNPVQWIIQRAQDEYGTPINNQAAVALAGLIGEDLRAADSELAKLATYVNAARLITERDVAQMTAYVVEANVFEMVDALGKRDGATAAQLMHRLLDNDDPLRLFGMVVRQFRLLILAREFLNAGGSPKETGKVIGVHPFVGEKAAAQARAFTIEQLEHIYRHLLELDINIKTGKIDAILALDLLLAGVAS